MVAGCSFKLSNLVVDYDVQKEPVMGAQWVFLPGFALSQYRIYCLQAITAGFGKFLITDNMMIYGTRIMSAWICVEVN